MTRLSSKGNNSSFQYDIDHHTALKAVKACGAGMELIFDIGFDIDHRIPSLPTCPILQGNNGGSQGPFTGLNI